MQKDSNIIPSGEAVYKNSRKKGPFGMFLYKMKNPNLPRVKKALIKIRNNMLKLKVRWARFSKIKSLRFFAGEELTEAAQKRIKKFNATKGSSVADGFRLSNILFGYSVYKKQPDEYKDKLKEIFYKRYDYEQSIDFSRQYLKEFTISRVKKSAFILWMSNYLKHGASDEILELSSFDIAVKMGQLWNNLSSEEKTAWEKLSRKVCGHKKRVPVPK